MHNTDTETSVSVQGLKTTENFEHNAVLLLSLFTLEMQTLTDEQHTGRYKGN